MRMPIHLAILLAVPGLSGADAWAQAARQEPAAIVRLVPGADWRRQASPRDRERLDALPAVWAEALESVRAGGRAPAVVAAGPLLDSRGGRDGPPPGAGQYRCRSIRLGAVDPSADAFIAYPAFRCRVRLDGGAAVFEKTSGSQRTAGVILPDGPARSVLLGTEAIGGETGFPAYGEDAARDRIAAVEALAPGRWRLVFPRPDNGAILEVMELVASR
jgi:hypothetical protein